MSADHPILLSEAQQDRLLAFRTAWDEGEDEERLEALRQREEDADTLHGIARILEETAFARGRDLTHAELARLLTLVRALAPNPNIDARLLRRPNEPEEINRDLRDLLFGTASAALRIRNFLSRRHMGDQTALQFLCAAFPDIWPLITRAGLRTLELEPEQERQAVRLARRRFDLPAEREGVEADGSPRAHAGVPDSDPVLRLLANVLIYESARDIVQVRGFVELHRLLSQRAVGRKSRPRRLSSPASLQSPAAGAVREHAAPAYTASPGGASFQERASDSDPDEIDISGVTASEVLARLEAYVSAEGFTYPPLAIRDYYISLQSKPFVLLSGLSGTGKTRLTSLFAEALTGDIRRQYRLLPVRPDWTDSAPIVGYVNVLAASRDGREVYMGTPFLDFLLYAGRPENRNRAYFLCLDELNLARVEHYLAEVLSAMETPGHDLILPNGARVPLPPNLFLTGTLNLDEATHTVSRKVLDRANTIAFHDVFLTEAWGDAAASRPEAASSPGFPAMQALFLRTRAASVRVAREKLQGIAADGTDFAAAVLNRLAEANALLTPYGMQFAYRVRDEVLRYCANSFDSEGMGLLTPERPDDTHANLQIALDLQLLQKILPRFTGTREQIEAPARELLRWADTAGFTRTTSTLARLTARLERDGFAGFDEA